MRLTRPSAPTTIEAIRFWDVWPRNPLASATPLKASTATSVAPTIRMAHSCPVGSALMRVTIAAIWVVTFALGVAILAVTPGLERLPPGGRAIPYIGVALAWGFAGVGSYAWLRRPDNRTGMLMMIVGLGVAVTGLQLFDAPWLWAIGAMCDTLIVSLLVHLLLAFPSGRLEGRGARIAAALAYAAGALQPLLIPFSPCEGVDCPADPVLISDNASIAEAISTVQGAL